jgi:hypothetical protein
MPNYWQRAEVSALALIGSWSQVLCFQQLPLGSRRAL